MKEGFLMHRRAGISSPQTSIETSGLFKCTLRYPRGLYIYSGDNYCSNQAQDFRLEEQKTRKGEEDGFSTEPQEPQDTVPVHGRL
jgi:hypothetical protein